MADIRDEIPVSHRDLIESRLTAVVTTVDSSSRPQSTAVWYLIDDDGQLKSSTTSDRQKYKNLLGNPNCSLFIMDPDNAHRTLEIRAFVELAPDPDKAAVRKFAKAYGVDEEMFLEANDDRYTVTYRPRRIVVNPPG